MAKHDHPLGRVGNWLLGQVAWFNPQTHTYNVTAGGHLIRGVPRLLDSPGNVVALPPDTMVAMHQELGEWVIAGVINRAAGSQVELAPTIISEITPEVADEIIANTESIGDARAHNAPDTLRTHDWIQHGEVGQLLGILANGVVEMKSSAFAQIRTFQHKNLVQIISYLFQHITAMGDAEIKEVGDKVTYEWKGASNKKDVAAKDWNMFLTVGAQDTGNLFSFRITQPGGARDLAEIAIGADGRLHLTGEAVHITAGTSGNSTEVYPNDHQMRVEGSALRTVIADDTVVVKAGQSINVSKQQATTVGSRNEIISNASVRFVGGTERSQVMGDIQPLVPGARAGTYEFINGGLEVVIGNPVRGGIDPTASANWITYKGGINFVLQMGFAQTTPPAGGFNVISAMPGSVNLGIDGTAVPKPDGTHEVIGVPAPFSLMKYEPFEAMMNVFFRLIDSHIHNAQGPTGPTSMPLPPQPGSMAKTLMPMIKSMRVKVGL